MFDWKVVFAGHQLCSIPKYQELPCTIAAQHPWVPQAPEQNSIPGYMRLPRSTASLVPEAPQ